MSNSSPRTRWTIPEPRGSVKSLLDRIRSPYVGIRFALCAVATIALWVACSGWAPSFPYRARLAPLHTLQARVPFDVIDLPATNEAKALARTSALCYYRHSPTLLENLRLALRERVFEIRENEYNAALASAWSEFFGDSQGDDPSALPSPESYERFRQAIAKDEELAAIERVLEKAFAEYERTGLLAALEHQFGEGDMQRIVVVRSALSDTSEVDVAAVRISSIRDTLRQRLVDEFQKESQSISDAPFVAARLFDWISPKLPTTLSWDRVLTRSQADMVVRNLPPVMKHYQAGDPLALLEDESQNPAYTMSRRPLGLAEIALLQAEHDAFVRQQSVWAKMAHSAAFFGMLAAALALLCAYLHYRHPDMLDDLRRFITLLALFVAALVSAWILSMNVESRAEIVPIVMLSMLVAIAFNVELAILLGGLAAIVFSIAHGYGLGEFVLLAGTTSTASLLCRTIRSRTRLIYVGFAAASVAGPTTIGVNYMLGQPITIGLLLDALWFSGGAMLAALLMTGALPFLEKWFEVRTDISLLELGDANHLLLRELVQRAPGTYNHSISVATIAEAAAEVVGANGLLCRVGAYFHDIGKMRKPEYFVENQVNGESKHADLVPTMSTLVIIAHVKDGAEMARQHRLPKRVIDIIEQHHGTTLVEYFYNEASRRASEDAEPEESSFRYPGPEPQTAEAAIVMLADAAESASRALRDPGPARLESLVESIVLKRVTAGQLDYCSLTLSQLHAIKESLIKSLNAMYHARIKYPETTQPA